MRINIRIPARPTVDPEGVTARTFLEKARACDEYGFERLTLGDTQLDSMECFCALSVLAFQTRTIGLGPGVTNPVTRDVGVLANILATLDVFSGGRAFCLLGRGDGAVHNVGLKPANFDQIRASYLALRQLLEEGEATVNGRRVRLPWSSKRRRKVPIYLVAEGPRMLELAGQIADGVLVGTGLTPEIVRESTDTIHAAARAAGRDPADVDIWWHTRSGVAETREEALKVARESIASAGNHGLRGDYAAKKVPSELHDRLREYHARFDYAQKGRASQNAPLAEELGLAGYFLARYGVVGTPDEVVDRLHELESYGVRQISLGSGLTEAAESLHLIGQRVLPRVH